MLYDGYRDIDQLIITGLKDNYEDRKTNDMIHAYIFDLDGTLVDSELLWCKALQHLVAVRGLSMSDSHAFDLVLGRAWSHIVTRLRRDYPTITEEPDVIERESVRYYAAMRGTSDIRIHSSIRLLERLAQRHPVAIVSGSTRQQVADAIALMGIGNLLQFYLGSEDVPHGKPDPAGFLLAARRFGVPPNACLVFEDSTAGVLAAKAAGMRCIALRRQGHPHQNLDGADEILPDLSGFNPAPYGTALP